MPVRIIGTGSYVPEKIVTNEDLEKLVDTSDAWITERTGIHTRRVTGEGTAAMAVRAAGAALERAGMEPEELDMILVGTSTGDFLFPGTACQVQGALGASGAVCFDLSAACSGFLFTLNTAKVYLESGAYKSALVIGADTLSKTIDWSDRSTCVLFGDGAGAAVLKRCGGSGGVGEFLMGSDGGRGGCLSCPASPVKNPWYPGGGEEGEFLSMNGQEVFRFAVKTVPETMETLLERAGLGCADIKYFILHQANERIIASVARRMKQPLEKFPMNLGRFGNTSGASIPILLDELNREGRLKEGDRLLLAGFGAGLTWGATIITW